MRFVFLIFLNMFFCILANAQEGLKISSEIAQSFSKGLSYVEDSNKAGESCQVLRAEAESSEGLQYTTCATQEKDYSNLSIFVLGPYESFESIPEFLKKEFPAPEKDQSKLSRFSIAVMIRNDNTQIIGLGVRRSLADGDDSGFTSGSTVSLGAVYDQTYDIQASITGNAYTKQVENSFYRDQTGQGYAQQKFRNETIAELFASSARAGKLRYWEARVGLVNISSKENFGFLDGTWQQQKYHQFLKNKSPGIATTYTNLNDGQKDQWGAYIGGMLGLQKEFELGSRCTLRVNTAAGGQISSLSGSSFFQAQAGATLSYQIGQQQKIAVGVDVTSTMHSAGVLNEAQIKAGFQGKSVEYGIAVQASRGPLRQNVSYNTPNIITGKNDKTWSAYFKYYFN
jgi:hypothetical protein